MAKASADAQWSAHVKSYEDVLEPLTALWAQDALQIAHHRLLPLLKHDRTTQDARGAFHFLDVGCGPGALSFAFADKYMPASDAGDSKDIRITASDLSDGMLQRFRERLQGTPSMLQSVSAVKMDGLTLDAVESESIDALGSNFGLSIFPDRARGWASAHRVLRPDGVLVATAWDQENPQARWFDDLARLFNAAADGADEDGQIPLPSPKITTDRDRVAAELRQAGFRRIEVYHTSHTIVFQDARVLVEAKLSNPMTAKYLSRLTREQIEAALLQWIRRDADPGNTVDDEDRSSAGGPCLVPFAAYTILARK